MVTLQRAGPGFEFGGVGDFDVGEAAAEQEGVLVGDEVAGGADFAFVSVAFAQFAGDGEAAAVAEFGEFDHHQIEVREEFGDVGGAVVAGEEDAEGGFAGGQGFVVALEPVEADDEILARGEVVFVPGVFPMIGNDRFAFKHLHDQLVP